MFVPTVDPAFRGNDPTLSYGQRLAHMNLHGAQNRLAIARQRARDYPTDGWVDKDAVATCRQDVLRALDALAQFDAE